MYYATKDRKSLALRRLRQTDVLITTPHMVGTSSGLPAALLRNVRVHRLVVDEAHLLYR